MSRFQVLDNNEPADCHHFKLDPSWDKSVFDTFEQAEEYALEWLGLYAPDKGELKPNTPYCYSGAEDYLEILVVD